MKKKGLKKRILLLITLLFILVPCIVAYTTKPLNSDKHIAYAKNNLDEVIKAPEVKKNRIEELREKYNNDNIIGELIIEDTKIAEPIVKYTNNDYYLYRNAYNNKDKNGAIFADYRTNLDSKKVLIFGHSSIYEDIPFNTLEKYYSKKFYQEHKYIMVIKEDETIKYEIFSVYVETEDFSYMNLNISNDTYNKHLKKYKEKSLYDTGVKVNNGDEIIILQTCSNSSKYKKYKKKYLLVIGRKVSK